MDAGDLAAWAQFGATVLGLGIAIGVPWAMHRADRREARRREDDHARDVGLAILGDIRTMRDRVAQLYHCMESGLPDHIQTWLSHDGIPTEDYLAVAESLNDAAPNLHSLGSAAKPVQYMLLLYRELVSDVATTMAMKELRLHPSTDELREDVRRCWQAARDAYLAVFNLFAEVHPDGPAPDFFEPPVSMETLRRVNTPPKPPA